MHVSLFHLVEPELWSALDPAASYAPPSLDQEGFIHLSTREQVEATAARFYARLPALLVIELDPARFLAELRYELADGQRFPHLYGPLNLDAVLSVGAMVRDGEGLYRLPATL